jgi:hypothetical protein
MATMKEPRRWPITPLCELGYSRHRISRITGIAGRRLNEGLTDWQADRAAIRLGYHPAQIWPDWIHTGLTPTDRDYIDHGWRTAWLWKHPA